jgi:hypothetical protein
MDKISLPYLKVRDGNDILSISYKDLIKYHGYSMLGGVALAYQIMRMGFPLLTNEIPQRGKFSFLSGIGPGGEGVIDSVEMVMRVKTRGTLQTDKNLVQNKPAPASPGGGRYYFEIGYAGKILAFTLIEGAIPPEFFRMSQLAHNKRLAGGDLSAEEMGYLLKLRRQLGEAVFAADPKDLFIVSSCTQ